MSKRSKAYLISAILLVHTPISAPASAAEKTFSEVERGRYLTDAGDCIVCHTADKGKPFSGGRAIETPFGTIYTPNITSDRKTGIGNWSEDDFYRALHSGVDAHGELLYPAFPYPYLTKLTRDDVGSIRTYLNTVPAVDNQAPPNKLAWPFNHRSLLTAWNWLYFKAGTYQPVAGKSDAWNRGAYLVEGAGHCGACHTSKNSAGADKGNSHLAGYALQGWFAPSLTSDKKSGLGSWSTDDIVEYLKTGRNKYAGAAGLMVEVVVNSTSKMKHEDLTAIAVYLKDVPAVDAGNEPVQPSPGAIAMGSAIFNDNCSACHQSSGLGVLKMFPPLAQSATVQSSDPTSVIRVVLEGAQTAITKAQPTNSAMPAYNWKLSDEEVAAVATYVRNAWGNGASIVTATQVKSLREKLAAH